MQITELLPELITKLAPTGPFPTDVSAQFAYWRQLVTKRQPGDLPKHYLQQEDQLLDLIWQKRGHVELSRHFIIEKILRLLQSIGLRCLRIKLL